MYALWVAVDHTMVEFIISSEFLFSDFLLSHILCPNFLPYLFLKDPSHKRTVICDDKLKELFDVDSFNGFSVSKLLSTHFVKT